jgi:hypothetical protein
VADQEARRLIRAIIQFWSAGNMPADEAILQLGSMLGIPRAEVMARLRGERTAPPARTEAAQSPRRRKRSAPSFALPATDRPQP